MSVKKRLKEYIAHSGLTISQFEKSINVSNGYINSISRGIGADKMQKIIENYSNLNINWLLTGNETMLKPAIKVHEPAPKYETGCKHCLQLEKEIAHLKREIDLQDQLIVALGGKSKQGKTA